MSGEVRKASRTEVEERLAALLTNAAAIRSLASAVEGTLGPKGLNCMLVDRFGDVTITNDGRTILDKIDVSHPAARLLIETAKAQDEKVGDGTTTAVLLASTLISEGVNQAVKGVPITKVIEGLRLGMARAVEAVRARSLAVEGAEDGRLKQAALVAARGDEAIAGLVAEAVRLTEAEKLCDPAFRLADWVMAKEGAENELAAGLIVEKERMNRQMPKLVRRARVLVVEDALEPEEMEQEGLRTESGFGRYLELQQRFQEDLLRRELAGQ